jgi:hypothetical protein
MRSALQVNTQPEVNRALACMFLCASPAVVSVPGRESPLLYHPRTSLRAGFFALPGLNIFPRN